MDTAEDPAEERPKGVAVAIGRIILVIISLVLPVSMVVAGIYWYSDCPQENNIPTYLLVGGIVYMLIRLFNFFNKNGKSNDENKLLSKSCLIGLLQTFLFVWIILGAVRIYKVYEPNYDPNLGPYCNKNLYLFAFWITTVIIGLKIIIICGAITVSVCKEWRKRGTTLQQDDQPTHRQEDANFIGVAVSEPTNQ